MKERDAAKAYEVSEMFQNLIISMGVTLLAGLKPEQQEYVLTKAQDEFRFWRIEEKLRS